MNCLSIVFAALLFRQVDPYSNEVFVPDTPVTASVTSAAVEAAKDETEVLSFLVRSDSDIPSMDVIVGDFRNGKGDVLPAESIDVSIVKAWWSEAGIWSSDRHGRDEPLVMMPGPIVHDDALIKVDMERKINLLRFDYPDGIWYGDIISEGRKTPFRKYSEPVRDAPSYVPFSLPANTTRQFWITFKVPRKQAPGVYEGSLELIAKSLEVGVQSSEFSVQRDELQDGRAGVPSPAAETEHGTSNLERQTPNIKLGTLNVTLTVYPFTLPIPRTHYNLEKRFLPGVMGTPTLKDIFYEVGDIAEAEKKYLAIYRSLAEHNVLNVSGPGEFKDNSTDDLGVRGLFLRYQAGMQMDDFRFGRAIDDNWYSNGTDENLEASLEKMRGYWKLQFGVLDKYIGKGNYRLLMSGRDEASVWGIRRQQPFFRELEILGGGAFITCGRDAGRAIGWGVTLANVSADSSYSQTEIWHRSGAEVNNYYAPATSVKNPDVWRRRGIRNWFADYDGIFEMAWMHSSNPWNDHLYSGDMYKGEFLALPQSYGVVRTLAYEAFREIADDVAYFTLHRKLAEKANDRAEWEWLERIEPDCVIDLVQFRREIARRIIALQEKCGPLPDEPWTRQIPALETIPPVVNKPVLPAKSAMSPALAAFNDAIAYRRFEEKLDAARLDDGHKALLALIKAKSDSRTTCFNSYMKLLDRCNESGVTDLADTVAAEAARYIDSVGNDPHVPGWKDQLVLSRAESFAARGEWKKALVEANRGAGGHDAMRYGKILYESAVKCSDFAEAQKGAEAVLKCISAKDSPKEHAFWMRRLQDAVSKAPSVSMPSDDGEILPLDE